MDFVPIVDGHVQLSHMYPLFFVHFRPPLSFGLMISKRPFGTIALCCAPYRVRGARSSRSGWMHIGQNIPGPNYTHLST